VTVIEMQDRLMPRVVAPVVSAFYQSYHESHGVRVLLNTQVREIHGTDRVGAVLCADGARVDADLVVVGIGVIPNTELARAAGLECRNGIVVDRQTRTSDPDIVAAGDCAEHFNPLLGRQLRLESVHNAIEQAKVAAATLAGDPAEYAVIPWFWSDQYDLKLQMAGISEGFDQIAMRGDSRGGKFAVFYFRGEQLLAVDTVNRPADHMLSRKLLANHAVLTPAQAADPQFDLKSLVPA
jgi:3-phenylpropionate/trans-cinnamate dioxygenase ferredoxin reductase subunit